MMNNQKGFSAIEGLLILVIVAILGFTGWFVWHSQQNANKTNSQAASDSAPPVIKGNVHSYDECIAKGGVKQPSSYPPICVALNGKQFVKKDNIGSAPNAPYETVFSMVPADLQKAIIAEEKKDAPTCVKNDRIVDYNGAPYDALVDYDATGYAGAGIGCNGGSWGIFAKVNGTWKFLAISQMGLACDLLHQYKFPVKFVALNDPQVECYVGSGANMQKYTN